MEKLTEEQKKRLLIGLDPVKLRIERICKIGKFNEEIEKEAKKLYTKICVADYSKRNKLVTPMVTVYLACEKLEEKVSLEEIDSRGNPFPPEIDKNHLEKMRQLRLKEAKKHLEEVKELLKEGGI